MLNRIKWIDSSRGLAILCLIFIHYVGAIEARGFISYDAMNYIKAFFRVATPYFIFIFGFTFSIIYTKKLSTLNEVKKLYRKLYIRLALVFIAREVIVLIGAIRYPDMAQQLLSILLYQQTSKSGEILTFYFLAILLAPITIYWMKNNTNVKNIIIIIAIYGTSYAIGSTFTSLYDFIPFRLFFYDVYAFFPFFSLVMFGMFCGFLYQSKQTDSQRLKLFVSISLGLVTLGIIFLAYFIPEPIYTLAIAGLKAPPHISYLLIYSGLAILLTIVIAICSHIKRFPRIVLRCLDILGRNSLLAYVLHYLLFLAAPISLIIFGVKNNQYELYTFIGVLLVLFFMIYGRDKHKQRQIKLRKGQIG